MTSVNIPRDDAATHIDTKAARKRTVAPAQPYPATPPVQTEQSAIETPSRAPRQLRQRRQGERRKQSLPVLLDTRSRHDRRNILRNSETGAESETDNPGSAGIDVYS
jgi:hypothetical protein